MSTIIEFATVAASPWIAFRQSLQRLQTKLFDPYRPEKYYMRGPGPKSREKKRREQQAAGL